MGVNPAVIATQCFLLLFDFCWQLVKLKSIFLLDTLRRYNPFFKIRLLLEQRIVPTLSVKRNKSYRSAIGRSGAIRRKQRMTFYSTTTFWLE
jgi:hypothetical protein